MKDFDEKRSERPSRPAEEREFKIGGEVFVMRDVVRPEAMTPGERIREPKLDQKECQCEHHRSRHEQATGACREDDCDCKEFQGKVLEPGSTIAESLAALDETILGMIENGEEGQEAEVRYRALRARADDPILTEDLADVVRWLVEEQTNRPTTPPSSSSASRGGTGTRSTAASSSRATEE
jgi:hypothetical protein